MPIRGKPERPHTSGNQGIAAKGLDEGRSFDFGVFAVFEDARYVEFGVSATFADRAEVEFEVQAVFADRKALSFGVSSDFIDVDGTEIQRDLFGISAEFGASSGYPSAPVIDQPGQVVIGQRVERRGKVIPVAD